MKKSLLALVALAAIGLTACGEKPEPTPSPDPGPTPAPAVEVPTEEGKCTFYFTMADASVEMQSYASVYFTSGFFKSGTFVTGYEALEMKKLEGTNVYYGQVANENIHVDYAQSNEYQLVLGYNKSANMPDASSGLQWVDGRKSDECAAPGGLNNLSFTYTAGDLKVGLGTHTFSTALPKPTEPLKNYKFKVEFEEAVPEYGSVLIFGSFDGWNTPSGETAAQCAADHEMTPNEDRTVWTFNNATLVAGDYQCKILVEYNTNVETGAITWNAVTETPENYAFSVTQADGDGYVLDILGAPAHYSLADPSVTLPLEIVVTNIGGELDSAVEGLGIGASFNGWTITGNMCELEGENYVYRHAGVNGTIEFAVMSKSDWSDQAHFADGNIKVAVDTTAGTAIRVTVKCDFSKFGSEVQVLTAEENIVVEYAKAA